jgi:SAM-dependent methyltransferase
VSCPWCGKRLTIRTPRLAVCSGCGAGLTWPIPDGRELELAYDGWYRPSSGRFAGGGDRLLRLSRARLARRLDRIAPPGPIVDVGAGDGTLVLALRRRGREAVGLERMAGHEHVIARDLLDFDQRLGQWAAVVFWHSLEHVPHSAAALDRARELLSRDGVLVLALPNLSSWQAELFGPNWFHLDIPRHLTHLPARVVIDALVSRGLEVERVSYWRGGQVLFGWLFGLVGLLPGRPDLYAAIRQPSARARRLSGPVRLATLAAAAGLAPVAGALGVAEVLAGAGGTVYVEARLR